MRLFDRLELPASADFHVHLREGDLMEAVTTTIRDGGVDLVYVMVNLASVRSTEMKSLIFSVSQIWSLQSLQSKQPYPTGPTL